MTPSRSPAAGHLIAGRRGFRRRIGDELTALVVIAALKVILYLPERLIWRLADFAGGIAYRVAATRRARARRNLRRVLDWMAANGQGTEAYRAAATDPRAFEELVKSAFKNHARYYVEMARAPKFTAPWVIDRLAIETPVEVAAWMTERRALLLIGMHFGAIELPGFFAVHRLGLIVAPMETVANDRVQRYIFSTRATIGVRIVSLEAAGTELLAALRRNEPVGLIADRDITGAGIEVEMFGGKTRIPAGPVLLAAETGAPMYVSGVRRVGPGRYLGNLRQLQPPEGASRRERSRAMAREEARLFERIVVDAPEQWLSLFHPIWPDLEAPKMRSTGADA